MKDRKIVELVISLILIALALLLLYSRTTPTKPLPEKPQPQPVVSPSKEMLTVEVNPQQPIFVGIIGESRGDATRGEAFNTVVLHHLFQVLMRKHVQAVFSTGNIVSAQNKAKQPDTWLLQQQLQEFSQLYKSVLPDVPFFPALGLTETAASNTSQKFRETFNLGVGNPFDADTFGYTVSIDRALFVVIPTIKFNVQTGDYEPAFFTPMLEWLDSTLKKGSQSYSYLFVVGNEPAFIPTVTFPDKQTPQRDAFWQILVDNSVVAYFCSHDQMFDRTNKNGVWQIISGGGGAPYSEERRDKPFFHCLLLTIPAGEKKSPTVDVLDESGNVKDTFQLTSESLLLHQKHISEV